MRISDWSSDVCSSDLIGGRAIGKQIEAQSRRELFWGRLDEHLRRAEDRHRQLLLGEPALGQQMPGNRAVGGIEPTMREAMFHTQVAHRIDTAINSRQYANHDGTTAQIAALATRRQYATERP